MPVVKIFIFLDLGKKSSFSFRHYHKNYSFEKMTIKIHLHAKHRHHTNGQKTVEVEAKTVGEALNKLVILYPGMKKELFDKKAQLSDHIEIYLNNASAYPGELEKKLKDGDEVQLIALLAGG